MGNQGNGRAGIWGKERKGEWEIRGTGERERSRRKGQKNGRIED